MKYIPMFVVLSAVYGFTSCRLFDNSKSSASSGSRVLQLNKQGSQDLTADAGTPDSLCKYLKSNNYFPSNTIAAGTEVAFSTSYGVDSQEGNSAEAGQANGVVTSEGIFEQRENVTSQLLLCPGASGGLNGGKCLWKMSGDDGYAELAFRVVCNRAANYGSAGKLHPGYSNMKVAKVGFTASTAGKTFTHSDAVEVELSGGDSTAHIYFEKGTGLVATEFRENSMPGGTAKVYLGSPGMGLLGDH